MQGFRRRIIADAKGQPTSDQERHEPARTARLRNCRKTFSIQLMSGDERAPPLLAIVLISAIPPTARSPLRNEVASDQNGPIMLIIPTWANVRENRTSHGDCRVALRAQPIAARSAAEGQMPPPLPGPVRVPADQEHGDRRR